jgi:hypothetical protein
LRFQLAPSAAHPSFLDLPWSLPLDEWESERLVEVARGIHRHIVVFVNYEGRVYVLKELPQHLAEREYRLLRRLDEEGISVVEAVGVVSDRRRGGPHGDELDAVLITSHLEYSLPYRTLFGLHDSGQLQDRLLDALVELLVRLHLLHFFWGDCSLSNTLFRRDAGAFTAYVVDVETAELRPTLSDGMRRYDLEIAAENVAGELMDLRAERGERVEIHELSPVETADVIRRRYESLWLELTRDEVFSADDRFLIEKRLRRLNELGYDISEVELSTTPEGLYKLRIETQVVEPGHHRRRLHSLTGLAVQENQARRLIQDIDGYRRYLELRDGLNLPESVAAYRWLTEIFKPTIDAVPEELRGRLAPAEIFHQVLEHRWFLSEESGEDVDHFDAIGSYVHDVLVTTPDEQLVFDRPDL